jgi:nitroreductase
MAPRIDIESADYLLTTTRSVRKRLDFERPVEPEVIERCIEIAFQAPTGSNTQNWAFVVVTDAAKRAAIGRIYKRLFDQYTEGTKNSVNPYAKDDPRFSQLPRVLNSAGYLADQIHRAPVHIFPCAEGRVENAGAGMQALLYGSILPAAWSLMLALRARGLGSAWTTLHLLAEKEIAEILGIPATVTQAALLPVAYFQGEDFKPAKRLPARQFTHWNTWGQHRR